MTILHGSSGGVIGGGQVSGMVQAPNISEANLNALSRLGQQWGNDIENVLANMSSGRNSIVVNFGIHQFDDERAVSSAKSDIEGLFGVNASNPSQWNDLMKALAMLGGLVTDSVVEDGTIFVTAKHKSAQLPGSSGLDTFALLAIARAFKFDAREMGVEGYGSLFYLGIRLFVERGEAQIQRHSATIYPFTVKWLDPPD